MAKITICLNGADYTRILDYALQHGLTIAESCKKLIADNVDREHEAERELKIVHAAEADRKDERSLSVA